MPPSAGKSTSSSPSQSSTGPEAPMQTRKDRLTEILVRLNSVRDKEGTVDNSLFDEIQDMDVTFANAATRDPRVLINDVRNAIKESREQAAPPENEERIRKIARDEVNRTRHDVPHSSSTVRTKPQNKKTIESEDRWHRHELAQRELKPATALPHFTEAFSQAEEEEASLQNNISELICKVRGRCKWVDTHSSPFDDMCPDFTAVPADCRQSAFTAIGFLELKAASGDIASDTNLGQMASYLATALEAQGTLSCIRGVIASRTAAVAVTCRREGEPEQLHFYEDPASDNPAQLVSALVQSITADRTVVVDSYRFGKQLGRGSSCTTYTIHGQDTYVGKIFQKEEVFHQEIKMLGMLSALSVPQIVTASFPHLVLQPRGRHFRITGEAFTEKRAEELMTVLKSIHEMGLVHSDVRPSNFFLDTTGQRLFLNDWGSAGTQGEAFLALPPNYRRSSRRAGVLAEPSDDLFSFVLSCYHVTSSADAETDFPFRHDELPQSWKEILDPLDVHDIVLRNVQHRLCTRL